MSLLLQQGLLATYLIPGCVGKGVMLGSESSSGSKAAVVSGNLEIWEPENLGIWNQQNKLNENSQNNKSVVWISRKQLLTFVMPFHTFFIGWENAKHAVFLHIFSYLPSLGPLLLSTLGGEISELFFGLPSSSQPSSCCSRGGGIGGKGPRPP